MHRQDEAGVTDGLAVISFDRSRAHRHHVAEDGGRRFNMQRCFYCPNLPASRSIETKQRAVPVLVKSLPNDHVFAVRRHGWRTEKKAQRQIGRANVWTPLT